MKARLTITLLLAALLFGLAVNVALADEPGEAERLETILRRARYEQRAQYYRGVYDVCVWSLLKQYGGQRAVTACRELVPEFMRQRWYEQESPGWTWPLVTGEMRA